MLIGYARVSTGDQDLALQLDALKAAGCARWFSDTASGSLQDRPQLKRAFEELRDGEDTLVVWRLDRLGRSLRHLIELIGELEQRQLGFRSLTEGIDTTTSSGRLVFHIFGAIAEFERQLIRERTHAGLKAARARGRRGGRRTGHHRGQAARRARVARGRTAHDAADRPDDRRRPRHALPPPRTARCGGGVANPSPRSRRLVSRSAWSTPGEGRHGRSPDGACPGTAGSAEEVRGQARFPAATAGSGR